MENNKKVEIETRINTALTQKLHFDRVIKKEITFDQFATIFLDLNKNYPEHHYDYCNEWLGENKEDVENGNHFNFAECLIDPDNIIGEHLNFTPEEQKYATELFNKTFK